MGRGVKLEVNTGEKGLVGKKLKDIKEKKKKRRERKLSGKDLSSVKEV